MLVHKQASLRAGLFTLSIIYDIIVLTTTKGTEMDSNKIIVHAITVEALQDMVDYMEETPVSLTEVEVDELTDLLQDAITDVVADFINHRNS